ncbi:tetratricopeptide repeat protein [Streptomyces sp. H34-S4]|uniref:tetratricopeptide repeat protein n=1 Tax=Streptomyces sp. H34-S4 TaxID=2996463 RepID=UPI00226D4A45|nr:tetratricopeptide repeat protein [Streptomyces sp. H34-S4]MCY0936897.1 tetratricopeptide repeat protein [Streptomyces sp. H34-S4]
MDPHNRNVEVEVNHGIISLGDGAKNTINNYHHPLPSAASLSWPGGPGRLSPTALAAGRFVGREQELRDLDTALLSGTGLIAQTVAGLGGVGKSALACRYAQLRQDAYSPVWWIAADSPDQIEAGLVALAVRLVPELNRAPLPDAAAWARSWLACHDGWLLILDDVCAPADVQDLIGSLGGGRFLITSRLAEGWQGLVDRPVTLGVLSAEDATALLRHSAGRTDLPDAARLSARLGHLPLAVVQAGAYLSQTGISVAEYLYLLDHSSAETFRQAAAGTPEDRTMAAVWTVTLDMIVAQDELALEAFRTLAWFAPDGIPRSLLAPMADQGALVHALGLLRSYRMVDVVDGSLSMHRLIQEVFRTPDAAIRHREDEAVARGRARSVDLLLQARPPIDAGLEAWQGFLPHADALVAHTTPAQDDPATNGIFEAAARFLGRQNLHHRAVGYCSRIAGFHERTQGPQDPATLHARANLAAACLEAGDRVRGRELLTANLADQQRVLGPDHRLTLASRAYLAAITYDDGDRDLGIQLLEASLAHRERALGPDHPDTLVSRGNLAVAHHERGDMGRAVGLFEAQAGGCATILGPDHFNTLRARYHLAGAHHAAGNATEAARQLGTIFADCERILGVSHPLTAAVRSDVAAVASELTQQPRDDIEQLRADLIACEREHGPEHRQTLSARATLGSAYLQAKDVRSATEVLETALGYSLWMLGPDHPATLRIGHQLGDAYFAAGRYALGTEMVREALADCERLLGPGEWETENVRATLVYMAGSYLITRIPGVRTTSRLLKRMRRRGRPDVHQGWTRPDTDPEQVRAAAAEGLRRCRTGELRASEGHLRVAADGGNSSAMANLGMVLARTGRPAGAEFWLLRAVDVGEEAASGPLGSLLAETGRFKEAQPWLRRGAATGAVDSMMDLAHVLIRTRRGRSEAEQWYRQAAAAGDPEAARFLEQWTALGPRRRPGPR